MKDGSAGNGLSNGWEPARDPVAGVAVYGNVKLPAGDVEELEPEGEGLGTCAKS